MLIFGLAWAASWISSGIPPMAAIQEAATFRFRGITDNPPPTWVHPGGRSVEQAFRISEDVFSTQPQAPQFDSLLIPQGVSASVESSSNVSVMSALGSGIGTQPIATASWGVPPATLLPNWLNAQNSVLTLAESFTRWLGAISPLPQPEEETALSVPAEILSEENLICLSLDDRDVEPVKHKEFSTWLRECMLLGLPGNTRESLAVRIEETLSGANWQGSSIEPTLAENLPAARVGSRTLFIVTEEISQALGHNAEVVTTQWVNQLRLALGAAALPLVESQMKMYDLKPTGDFLSGEASWYGPYFQGRLTATGEIFDKAMFTAAHKTLPFDTFLKITNLKTGNVLVVRINDRGPYVGDRILDLSQGSANYLGSPEIGVIPVTAEFLEPENRLQASLPYRAIQPSQDPLITMWRP